MTDKKPTTRSNRNKKVRVKMTKKRTVSSARWLERQLNDPFVKQAKEAGYRARSAFKIIEMDDKMKFFKPGAVVVDLGAAPGSWSQIAMQRLGGKGKVVATDILDIEPLPGVDFLQGDFTEDKVLEQLLEMLGGKRADVVLSDMAANTTGQKAIDHIRTVYLVELAWDFAKQILAPNGTFIAKVFQGGTEKELLADLKKHFKTVKHIKPDSSRKESPELYVACIGFRKP